MLMKKATDAVDDLDALASIRRGLAQAKKGLGRPVDEVFDDLERKVALARPAGSGTDLKMHLKNSGDSHHSPRAVEHRSMIQYFGGLGQW